MVKNITQYFLLGHFFVTFLREREKKNWEGSMREGPSPFISPSPSSSLFFLPPSPSFFYSSFESHFHFLNLLPPFFTPPISSPISLPIFLLLSYPIFLNLLPSCFPSPMSLLQFIPPFPSPFTPPTVTLSFPTIFEIFTFILFKQNYFFKSSSWDSFSVFYLHLL